MENFEFIVRDSEGLWGAIRVPADSAGEAKKKIRRWLNKTETFPNGCLNTPFSLDRTDTSLPGKRQCKQSFRNKQP